MPPGFYRHAAWLAFFTERYVLSVFYLVYAWAYFLAIRTLWPSASAWNNADFAAFAQDVTMLLLMFSEGVTLLLGRRAEAAPKQLRELLVPLAASFFYLTYTTINNMPPWLQDSLGPENWQVPLQVAGLGVVALGAALAAWGVAYLGRSFGIFVAVRKVVMRGPYRFVRHPIYFGYLFMFAGVALTYFCPAVFILVAIHYALFFYRARLEEARLAEFSPEYREYMKHTGFLFPKFRKING